MLEKLKDKELMINSNSVDTSSNWILPWAYFGVKKDFLVINL
jgi:hypothetical protein